MIAPNHHPFPPTVDRAEHEGRLQVPRSVGVVRAQDVLEGYAVLPRGKVASRGFNGPIPQSEIFVGSLTNENPFTVTIANTNNVKVRFHRTEWVQS